MQPIECLHVALARTAHGAGDPALLLARDQQVDVVAHQHVRVDRDASFAAGLAQKAEVGPAIRVAEEDG